MNDSLTTKFIEISGVEQTFKTRKGMFPALREIHLTVAKGEFVALIGHSGCGKSTLLNLIAGLTTPTQGVLLCANREIAGPGPERAVVFQNHSLLPWLTCFENVYLAVERVFGAGSKTTGAPSENKAQLKARTDAAQVRSNARMRCTASGAATCARSISRASAPSVWPSSSCRSRDSCVRRVSNSSSW